jgi:hypothetical protein
MRRRLAALACMALLASGQRAATQGGDDPVAALIRKIDRGSVRLTSEGESRYLRSLLKALDVPESSQSLVFVSNALQTRRVNATNPRALYFNDSVTVGWVRGGFIELVAQDPRHGLRFYSLDDNGRGTPALVQEDARCVFCHAMGIAGSVPALRVPVGHTRAFEDRFGGWYVTGNHGSAKHVGNWDIWEAGPPPAGTRIFNLESLKGRFDLTGYLTPYSDIVAQMVMQHRGHISNALNRLGATPTPGDISTLVDRMLLVDERALTAPIRGTSGFAEEFQALGPRDGKGRSLRDLDLTKGLLRYPCSYMIYAPQFDALPASSKAAVYTRLWDVLSGADRGPQYARLSPAARTAVIEILRETKQGLPRYYF